MHCMSMQDSEMVEVRVGVLCDKLEVVVVRPSEGGCTT